MPQILELTFRNVCSYGNKMQRIPFGPDPKLMLIVGENGAGKTTISNALEFSWYGKTRRRLISELANRYNKHLETYNKFRADDGRIVEIARGVEPAYFDLKVDGQPDNKAVKGRANEYIENQLINIPFDVSTNTMILSINDFKSFVSIKAEDKRKIIDRIFGLDVLNRMNVMLKADLKNAKDELARLDMLMLNNSSSLSQSEEQLASLKSNLSNEAEQRKTELIGIILNIDNSIKQMDADISNAHSEISKLTDAHSAELVRLTSAQSKINEEHMLAESALELKCDTDIEAESSKIKTDIKAVLDALEASYSAELQKLSDEVNEAACVIKNAHVDKISKIDKTYDDGIRDLNEKHAAIISKLDAALTDLTSGIDDAYKTECAKINKALESSISSHNDLVEQKDGLYEELRELKAADKSLTDKIALYEKGICPECDTDLTDHHHVSHKDEYVSKLESNKLEMDKIGKRMSKIDELINAQANAQTSLNRKLTEIKATRDTDVENAKSDIQSKKDKSASVVNEKMMVLMSEKTESTHVATEEYNSAYAGISTKHVAIQELKHSHEIEVREIRNGAESKLSEISSRHNAVLNENKKILDAAKSTNMLNNSGKINDVNNNYNGLISEKKQSTAVLITKRDAERGIRNMHAAELAELEVKLSDNTMVKSLEESVNKLREQSISIMLDHTETSNRIKLYLATQDLLVEDGIKKVFMKTVLPSMNATIRRIIDEFQYKYSFHFNDDFDAVIEHMGHPISAKSLSTGEEKMVDIIVVLSVMELIKMQHPKLNVMFLDEIFASLDQNYIEKTIKILRDFMTKYQMTIFAISHTMMPKEYFDNIINVSNDGMFSDLVMS